MRPLHPCRPLTLVRVVGQGARGTAYSLRAPTRPDAEIRMSPLRIATLTIASLCAFTANALLCRAALSGPVIDPASFTLVRLAAGALMLVALLGWRRRPEPVDAPAPATAPAWRGWLAPLMLFLYAATFSFAYTRIGAGTGALILFGAVQVTMFGLGLWRGERPSAWQWAGTALAVAGLAWLLSPGATAPPLLPALVMAASGATWGSYTLLGRGSRQPAQDTRDNFVRSLPFALVLGLVFIGQQQLSAQGLLLAVVSGAITSALGYIVWYSVLPRLSRIRASTVQLSVPVLTALSGVALLGESITLRLALAGAITLGGIALTLRPAAR